MWAIWHLIDLVIKVMKINAPVGAQKTIFLTDLLRVREVEAILFRQYLNESLKL